MKLEIYDKLKDFKNQKNMQNNLKYRLQNVEDKI